MQAVDVAAALGAGTVASALAIVVALRLVTSGQVGKLAEADRALGLTWAILGLTSIAGVAGATAALATGSPTPIDPPVTAIRLLDLIYGAAAATILLALTALDGVPDKLGFGLAGLALGGNSAIVVSRVLGWVPEATGHALVSFPLLGPVVVAAVASVRRLDRIDARARERLRATTWTFGTWAALGAVIAPWADAVPASMWAVVQLAAALVFVVTYPVNVFSVAPALTPVMAPEQ